MDVRDPNEPQQPDERAGEDETTEPLGHEPQPERPPGAEAPAAGAEGPQVPAAGAAGPQAQPEGTSGPQAPPPPQGEPAGAGGGSRRLFRSRQERVLGGVCGGLAAYLRIDPVIVRIVALVLLFFGGVSALVYLLALLIVPNEPEGGAPPGGAGAGPGRGLAIAGVVLLILLGWPLLLGGGLVIVGLALPLALLVAAGLLTWWVVSGEGPRGGAGDVARRSALGLGVLLACLLVLLGGAWAAGVGGGVVPAGLVIAAGVAAIVGAFLGGVRWLLPPALALALGVGLVSAAGIDLDGGVGEREYRPGSAAQVRERYELGMGELVVDLRDADLPRGDTPLDLQVGVGRAALIVPRDVCVATSADVGMGAVDVFDRNNGGVDVSWEEQPRASAATGRVVLNADVGLGALEVSHEPGLEGSGFGRRFGDDDSIGSGLGRRRDDDDGDDAGDADGGAAAGNTACEVSASAAGAGA